MNTVNDDELGQDYEAIYLNEESEQDSCLVLCIEERDDPEVFESIDTRVFVSYNEITKMYVVNGKRLDVFSKRGRNRTNFKPFMFCADTSNDVSEFLGLTLNTKEQFSYTFYNYNNLSYDSSENTYSFMEENMDKRYLIAAYDNVEYNKRKFRKLVNMTKKMYN
jgi:hypothetical protein